LPHVFQRVEQLPDHPAPACSNAQREIAGRDFAGHLHGLASGGVMMRVITRPSTEASTTKTSTPTRMAQEASKKPRPVLARRAPSPLS
jgi:hypothetical protein